MPDARPPFPRSWVPAPLTAAVAATLLALAALVPAAAPATAAPARPRVTARAGVLMDAGTGQVLWARAHHRPGLVASTTKMLTALVAEETFEHGQRIRVPEAAERVDGSRFGFQKGMVLTREQLLVTLLAVSANDAAETLAAAHPQGRRGFLAAMQAKAEALGCTDSTWRDPSGLDAPGHRASPADLAIIGRALLQRPELARIVASPTLTFRWPGGHEVVLANHNKLVRGRYPHAIGIKTGYTSRAGHTLAAAARRGDRTLIAVVLDSEDIYGDTTALFDYGFRTRPAADAERLGVPEEAAETEAVTADLSLDGEDAHELAGRPVPTRLAAGGAGLLAASLLMGLAVRAWRRNRYQPRH